MLQKLGDRAAKRRKIERFPQRRLGAISLIYVLLPMPRRQREWQATSDQGLDDLIGGPVPKMRLTPTVAISPCGTEGDIAIVVVSRTLGTASSS